ncbi:MAG: SusC/RagA family TonB-linked outer membrane protein [Bacteroidales bacterium]|nr:SusC/RagA family TonB-linked outer membrane protein [Bacteroidales bacterium]
METYNIAVVTDRNGKYAVTVPDRQAVLVFSFVGYATQEIEVGDRTELAVTLVETATEIEEVVVVGYGVQKKESIVGSIVQVGNKDLLKSGNVVDLKQALTGRLPGVTTSVSTGEPGSDATSIFIRGRNSWNNSQPLILVDGVERAMENVDVTEVETISVLKDASATAVFGVRGANGVILITTKRGQVAKPQLSFSYDATANMVSKLPEKLNSYDALTLRNESIERNVMFNEAIWSDYTPDEIRRRYRERDYPEYAILYPDVDWADALFKKVGWQHKAALNIRGGTDFVKYFGALAYLYEGDMFKEYDNHKGYSPSYGYNRFNFRTNLDFNLTKSTVFKVNLSGYYGKKDTNYSWFYVNTGGQNPQIWAAAYAIAPDMYPIQFPDGTWGAPQGADAEIQNPVATAYNLGVNETRTTNLNINLALEQKLDFITKGLSFSGLFNYDNNFSTVGGLVDYTNQIWITVDGLNTPATFVYPDLYLGPDQEQSEYTEKVPLSGGNYDYTVKPWTLNAEATSLVVRRMMYQAQLNYGRTFGRHRVGAMAVFQRNEYAAGSMFPSYREDWAFRATYDYDSRYFFETNGSYNGSEKFSSNYRFDFFPSFAVGWYLSNEEFFKVDWLNRLKFRYSLGWTGDDSAGARWAYQAQYSTHLNARLNTNNSGFSPYTIYHETVVPAAGLHWEKARKNNYGMETGFLNDMLTMTFDYYTEHRTDIIIDGSSRAIPSYFGNTPAAANLGIVNSRGFEIELGMNRTSAFGLNYWASVSMSHTRNKIIFRDDPQLQYDYLKQEGYAVAQTRTLLNDQIYQNWDEVYGSTVLANNDQYKIPGFYNIVDYNGDGVISDANDIVPYQYPDLPENTYNLSLGAGYRGFSLMVQFYGVNNVTRNATLTNFDNDMTTLFGHTRDYWSKDNPNASSFLPRYQLSQGEFIGNYFYCDGSYIRLKTAEIAYTLPKSLTNKLDIGDVRLYVNGNNLWFWSRLPDDRENTWSGGGVSTGAYPTMRRINFGININF